MMKGMYLHVLILAGTFCGVSAPVATLRGKNQGFWTFLTCKIHILLDLGIIRNH